MISTNGTKTKTSSILLTQKAKRAPKCLQLKIESKRIMALPQQTFKNYLTCSLSLTLITTVNNNYLNNLKILV